MLYKIAAIALVFFGEALAIAGEIFSSKLVTTSNWMSTFWSMTAVMAVSGAFLVGGYMLGYVYFKNIWIVVVVSLGTLAILEPLLAYILFQQMPTTGASIGLVLGLLAVFSAVLIP